jgi:hypothetical protein
MHGIWYICEEKPACCTGFLERCHSIHKLVPGLCVGTFCGGYVSHFERHSREFRLPRWSQGTSQPLPEWQAGRARSRRGHQSTLSLDGNEVNRDRCQTHAGAGRGDQPAGVQCRPVGTRCRPVGVQCRPVGARRRPAVGPGCEPRQVPLR